MSIFFPVKSNHPYPLVCFDLDGTLVDDTIYIWSTLHDHFRSDPVRRHQARDDFFAGRISYTEWFETDLELLDAAGADRNTMVELFTSLPIMPGALETIAELKDQGRRIAVISGSVDLVVETLFSPGIFDELLINRLTFDEGGRLIGGEPTPYDLERKADGLRALAHQWDLKESQVAFIGDNSNDIEVARVAGRSIAFNCKSAKLAQVADITIEDHDLRAILPHL